MTAGNSQPATVAVVMATYNRAHLISQAIDSILDQTCPPGEFIVVNDGSTDDTAQVIRRYGNRIRYIEKPNGGKPAALNMVLPEVQSTHTWIFDDDDVALPNSLEARLQFLDANPACDFVYSTNYHFSGDFSEAALPRAKVRNVLATGDVDHFLWLMEIPFMPYMLQGMLVPTRCYRAVGSFDEALLAGEDWDMMLRLARHFRAGFLNQPTFAERAHGGERGPAVLRHAEADRDRIWRKYELQSFRKLRALTSLGEYLPGHAGMAAAGRPLTRAQTRQALLARAAIMAIHGLYGEAADDFAEYLHRCDSASSGLSDSERRQVSTMAHVHSPQTVPPSEYYRHLGTLCRGRPVLFKAALRGLRWSISREMRARRPALVSRLFGLGAVMGSAYIGMPGTTRRSTRELQ